MNLQHFGRDLTDIRIWINPAIRIGIRDHFWLKFWYWRRFALSEHSLVVVVMIIVIIIIAIITHFYLMACLVRQWTGKDGVKLSAWLYSLDCNWIALRSCLV